MANNNYLEYTGWHKWHPTDEEFARFYTDKSVPFELKQNEYLLVYDKDDKLVEQYCYENSKLKKIGRSSIKIGKQKEKDLVYTPRNDEQICAFDLLKDRKKTVKLLTGHWGTGKTLLLVTAALEAFKHGVFDKIIWIRNNVQVAGTKDLGALPGEVIEKMAPWIGPMLDLAGEQEVRAMLDHGTLLVEPLQSLRGRNFENSVILCSEAENLTTSHIQLIIARAAKGTEVWFDADLRQRDMKIFTESRGIENMITAFAGEPLFGYVHLLKTERSETAALADKLDAYNTDKQ